MYEHMINWKMVTKNTAGLTPKGIDSAYIHIGMPNETVLVVTGDRNMFPEPLEFYPGTLIPVYGF